MNCEMINVSCAELVQKAAQFAQEGYRLVQICALTPTLEDKTLSSGFELYYSFDKDYKLTNLKLTVERNQEIPSISKSFFAAFLYENEVNEQFGTKIVDIALDFKGTLYKKAKEAPYDVYARKGGAK